MMNTRKLIMAIGMMLVAISFIYTPLASADVDQSSTSETGIRVGKYLSEITLEDLNGSQVTVGQSGKITVINFWATWCPPCRDEMPELNIFAQSNQQNVDFYAVNLQESNEKVSEFMNQNGYSMPILLDTNGVVAKKFQITAIPTTIIVNKHGMIKYRKSGAMTSNELEGIINSL